VSKSSQAQNTSCHPKIFDKTIAQNKIEENLKVFSFLITLSTISVSDSDTVINYMKLNFKQIKICNKILQKIERLNVLRCKAFGVLVASFFVSAGKKFKKNVL